MMRRIVRWLLRLAGVAGVLAAIALGLYVFYLPGEIERRIIVTLGDLGLSGSSVAVRSVTADAAHFSDIALGDDGRMTIGSIDATYDPDTLAERRVRDIRISAAQWRIALNRQGIDIGQLANLKLPKSDKPGPPPFDRVQLRASSIVLDYAGQSYRLPVEGSIVAEGTDTLRIDMRLDAAGIAIEVTGTISAVSTSPTILLAARAFDSVASINGSINNATGEVSIHVSPQGEAQSATLDFERSNKDGLMLSTLTVELNEPNLGATAVGREILNRLGIRGIGTVAAMGRAMVTFGGATPWRVDPVSVVVNIEPGDVQLPEMTLTGFTGKARFGGVVTPDGRRATLWADASGGLRGRFAGMDAAAERFQLKLDGEMIDTSPPAMIGMLDMKNATLHDAARGVDVAVESLDVKVDGRAIDANQPTVAGMVEVTGATLRDAARGVDIAGVTASVPLAIGAAEAPPAGNLSISKVAFADHHFENVLGTLAFVDDRLRFTAVVPVLETASLNLNGHVTGAAGGVGGEIFGRVDRFTVTDAQLLGRRLPALAAWRITGDFEADAQIAFAGSTIQPRITLTMHNAMIGDSENDIVAGGVDGSITLNSLAPLTTPPHQTLTVANAHVGKLDLLDGQIAFHLESADTLFVERSRWQVESEGRVTVHAFRYRFGSEQIDVELYFEGVNLRDWLAVLTGGKVEGEGRLYGRVPLTIRPGESDQLFRVGQGFLFADPVGGVVRVKDSQALGDVLDKTNPQFAVDAQMKVVKQRIIEGLADYEYRVLTFQFVPDDDDVTLSVHTAGRGRTGAKQEFGGLTINLHKFNSILTRELIRELGALPSVSDELKRFFE